MTSSKLTFGKYIRNERIKSGQGLREFARKLEVSASYLYDIELLKRSAPKPETVFKIIKLLNIDEKLTIDLASKSRKDIAIDIKGMIKESPETVKLLRDILDYSPDEKQIKQMKPGQHTET